MRLFLRCVLDELVGRFPGAEKIVKGWSDNNGISRFLDVCTGCPSFKQSMSPVGASDFPETESTGISRSRSGTPQTSGFPILCIRQESAESSISHLIPTNNIQNSIGRQVKERVALDLRVL
jgi:hypothetical protein